MLFDDDDDEETSLLNPQSPRYGIKWKLRKFCDKNLAICLIIASIACERSSFYIVDYQLTSALQFHPKLKWNDKNSSTAYYIFEGVNVLATFGFALLSDIKLGRLKTLMIGFPIILIGMILMTLVVTEDSSICSYDCYSPLSDNTCINLIIPTLIFIAIGSGALRSCLIIFGADQIKKSKITSRYFDFCVIAFNIGALVEILMDDLVTQDCSKRHFIIFFIGTCLLCACYLLFLIGWRYYYIVKPNDSVLYHCIPVIKNAYATKRRYKKRRYRLNLESSFTTISHTNVEQEIEEIMTTDRRKPNFLDMARESNRGKYRDAIVDDVKSFRIGIILFILIFPYKVIFTQFYSVLGLQTTQMSNATATSATLTLFDNIEPTTAIFSIILLNIFCYKNMHGSNRFFTTTIKFVLSMFIAILAMCSAGTIEIIRQGNCPMNPTLTSSNLTMFAHVPLDTIMGIAQAFNLLASYEFAYFVAPRSAQSTFMSFHTITIVAASYAGEAFDDIFASHNYTINFTCTSVREYGWIYPSYFFLFAVIQFIFIILFLICDRRLRITRYNPQHMEMVPIH